MARYEHLPIFREAYDLSSVGDDPRFGHSRRNLPNCAWASYQLALHLAQTTTVTLRENEASSLLAFFPNRTTISKEEVKWQN